MQEQHGTSKKQQNDQQEITQGQAGEHQSASLGGWRFTHTYANLPSLFYEQQTPRTPSSPQIVLLNKPLAVELGLDSELLDSVEGAAWLSGASLPSGALPLAQAYAGHQFGYFNRLGDGRALLLGEQITPSGACYDIQLKGAGRTPYSRGGDGLAGLGPMLREYIISEAMHALGIPTTRSLAVATTGDPVYREQELQGAVLTRVAASHLRVGTMQYAAQWGGTEAVAELVNYTAQRHYPKLLDMPLDQRCLGLLREVAARQASLIARWQLVGFVHGVMNTDNMTLSGETIDYGPCAFLDTYHPATVFSSIDEQGRYAYGNQPRMAAWNLARLAEALLPLLHEQEEEAVALAEQVLAEYVAQFEQHWLNGMRAKLGMTGEEADDKVLIEAILKLMQEQQADYTHTFYLLSLGKSEHCRTALTGTDVYEKWQARLQLQGETDEQIASRMQAVNPVLIPRNHLVEAALTASEQGDNEPLHRLLHAIAAPFDYDCTEMADFITPPVQVQGSAPYRTFCGT